MKVPVLIVDDESHARENLKLLVNEYCTTLEVVGEAKSAEEAKLKIKELKPKVIFLDIRMPSGVEGLNLLSELKEKDFMVVFVTAFKEYAIKAFNANAIHYLLKPIDVEDLLDAEKKLNDALAISTGNASYFENYNETLKNLEEEIKNEGVSTRIAISHSKGIKLVEVDDIEHLQANGNCTEIYFGESKRYLDTRTLKVYENILSSDQFYRIHKSHIINLDLLNEYVSEDGHMAMMKSGTSLPIARNRLSGFLKTIKSI